LYTGSGDDFDPCPKVVQILSEGTGIDGIVKTGKSAACCGPPSRVHRRVAVPDDMSFIDGTALRFDLDSDDTSFDQFIVAEEDGKIAGFGRLIQREGPLNSGPSAS
jgi:hypothetical protein